MTIQNRLIDALRDTRITSATAYHTLMMLGLHADENGNIGMTDAGQIASDPEFIAASLGVTKSAVFKSFRRLEEFGYLAWDRARGNERATGVTGRVRILIAS
jgi:DNA-binding MarR family transcriptional regulator